MRSEEIIARLDSGETGKGINDAVTWYVTGRPNQGVAPVTSLDVAMSVTREAFGADLAEMVRDAAWLADERSPGKVDGHAVARQLSRIAVEAVAETRSAA